MNNNIKNYEAYKTIGEVAKELNLVNPKNGLLQTHTLRFWEKQFRQIKPSIRAGNKLVAKVVFPFLIPPVPS